MKKFKALSIILAFVIGISVLSLAETASAPENQNEAQSGEKASVTFYGGKAYATADGKTVWLDGEILLINGVYYVAPEQLLTAMGFGLGWRDDIKAVSSIRGGITSYIITNSPVLWKGEEKYVSKNKTIIYKDVFYIPLDMFEYYTNADACVSGEAFSIRDALFDTVVGNDYRLSQSAAKYGGVYLCGSFAMERVYVTQDAARDYAEIVNNIAGILPECVNVYSIVVPTAAEFYGPSNVYTNQTAGIKTLYQSLSARVTPINAVKPLYSHAQESIYFRTDHHWTQRGAYYVYSEFAKEKGMEIAPLSSFSARYGTLVGSFANFAKGTHCETVLRANPDAFEKFLIPTVTAGAAYGDMYMQKYLRPLSAVYESTNSYSAFIGGDNPLSVFTTNVSGGKKIVILKESFGNAFATWAMNNYSEVYVIDVRQFNSNGNRFKLKEFYDFVKFDDLVIINYPVSVTSSAIRSYLREFI